MSTSRTFTKLPGPTGNDKISLGTFGYVTERNRQRAYDVVIGEFKRSGITQVMLANRMGKNADVVCRLLSRPQNWESDTFSSMLFAISGAVPSYSLEYPLRERQLVDFDTKSTTSQKVVKLSDYKPGEPNVRPGEPDFRQIRTA